MGLRGPFHAFAPANKAEVQRLIYILFEKEFLNQGTGVLLLLVSRISPLQGKHGDAPVAKYKRSYFVRQR